jgi:hypothetical protein
MFAATVSPVAATGSVTFYDGTTVLGSGKLANGQATLGAVLVSGVRSIRAFYLGDAAYGSGMSSVLRQRVETVPAEGFSPGVHLVTATDIPRIAMGDFNGDGKQDLVIGGSYGLVSVYLGNGDGTFQTPTDYSVGGFPIDVLVGDFNGDSKADLVVITTDDPGVSVMLGNGDGSFQSRVDYPAGNYPEKGAIADFNNDGNADLIVVSTGESSISIYPGNGDGTFQPRMIYPADLRSRLGAIGDFNADGNVDFVVANDNTLSVFLGAGDGSFQPRMSFSTQFIVSAVLVEDFNGDDKADLAVSGQGVVNIFLGNGDGTFRMAAEYRSADNDSKGLAICDFNGDGKADLAVTDPAGNVAVYLGNGDGTFQAPSDAALTGGFPVNNTVLIADFNGDGKADMVVPLKLGYSFNGFAIRLGGLGQMTTTALESSLNPSIYGQNVTLTATISPATGEPPPSGTVIFYDGQTQVGTSSLRNGQAVLTTNLLPAGRQILTAAYLGDPFYFASSSATLIQSVAQDTTSASLSSSANASYFGQSVALTATISPASGGPAPSGSVEFHDGAAVLGAAAVNGGAAVFLTSALSMGTHTLTAIYSGDTNHLGSTAAAFTQTVNPNSATVTALSASASEITLGQNVTLTATVSSASGTPSGTVAFYDGASPLGTHTLSGGQAVLTARLFPSGKRTIHAYYSGNNAFTPSFSPGLVETVRAQPANHVIPAPPINAAGYGMTVGDFNADGKSDLVLATDDGVNVLLSNGDGTFQPGLTSGGGADFSHGSVLIGDLNGDGISDVAVSSAMGVSVLPGNGDGTFQAAVTYAAGAALVAIADLDGDGNADLALSNGDILLGNGDGTFQPAIRWLDNSYSGFVAVADFNNDGHADILASTTTGFAVLVANGDGNYSKTASFANPPQYPYRNGNLSFALGDFNGDGKPDLIVIEPGHISAENPYWDVTVYLGRGDGTFQPNSAVSLFSFGTLTVGDFNGDGYDDFAVRQYDGFHPNGAVCSYLSKGNGTFGAPSCYITGPEFSGRVLLNADILVGDFNGDGRNDIALVGFDGIDFLLGDFVPTTNSLGR